MLWFALAASAGICIYIAFASDMADQVDLTAQRLNASEAQFPVNLLARPWFRLSLRATIPLGLGSAFGAVVLGGISVVAKVHSLRKLTCKP
jgi:hypothetical protein